MARWLDVTVVLLLAPFALAVGGILAIAVFLDSPGPIIYRSRRVGRHGRAFAMLKFRTMVRDAAGPSISAHRDVRYTPLGWLLAVSRLDELPQLVNVLRGEMRLVGPRPELQEFVDAYADEYREILMVPPGLTGACQLEYAWEGKLLAAAQERDRARLYRESILPSKVAIDLAYVRTAGTLRDALILIRTFLLPLRQLTLATRRALDVVPIRRPAARVAATLGVAAWIALFIGVFVSESSAPL